MEMKIYGRQSRGKTITSVFLRYICFYTVGALFWLCVVLMIYFIFDVTGEVIPANHMEVQLSESADNIRNVSKVTKNMIPEGCTFGVYEYDGTWGYGTFSSEEAAQAWEHYESNNIYSRGNGYYRFFTRDKGEVCIVRYDIAPQFRNKILRRIFPSPDIFAIFSFVILFLIHTVVVSRHYGKYMGERIAVLNEVTSKIRNQNLEFKAEHSEIKEVDEVLDSLYQMKEALRDSLFCQWNLEKNKEEQIAALTHDIKTPLTVIRGNAELLAEGDLSAEEKGYNMDILQSISTIEEYLAILNKILTAGDAGGEIKEHGFGEMVDMLKERVRVLAVARHCKILFYETDLHEDRKIICSEGQMMRAFDNILNNAIDYNPMEGKVEIRTEIVKENTSEYLTVIVTDEGPGFTQEGLKRAAEQFYQGDKSRNSKNHYGIGLYTAERFAKAQGGYLSIENAEVRGARVSLYIALCSRGL